MLKKLTAIVCAVLMLFSTNLTALAQEAAVKQNNALFQAVLDADLPQVAGIFSSDENDNLVNTSTNNTVLPEFNASWFDFLESDNRMPEGAYLKDATWADNSPVDTELPPSFVFDDSALEEYVYVPRAERENNSTTSAPHNHNSVQPDPEMTGSGMSWQDTIDAMTPGEREDWDNYVAIIAGNTYYSDMSGDEVEFLCDYTRVDRDDMVTLEDMELTLMESLPYAQISHEFDIPAEQLPASFPEPEDLYTFDSQMNVYLHLIDEGLYGGEVDPLIVELLLEGYPLEDVLSDSGVSMLAGDPGEEIFPGEEGTGAPYSYDFNEVGKVNLNSGALLYENVDYTLPGVNGLDLVIGRRYSSDEANVYIPKGRSTPGSTPYYEYYVTWMKECYWWVPYVGVVKESAERKHPKVGNSNAAMDRVSSRKTAGGHPAGLEV